MRTVTIVMIKNLLQDKLLAKMDNEEDEKMPYSTDDQVTNSLLLLTA